MHDTSTVVAAPERQDAEQDRGGGVSLWAVAGALWIVFIGQAWLRWMASETLFRPAPIKGPDTFDGAALLILRVIEVLSILIAAGTIWVFLVKPLIATRRLTLDGMIVIGSLLASGIDPLINYFHYTFAWNAHALNMGSWLAFFPLHQGPTRYAEGLDRMLDHSGVAQALSGDRQRPVVQHRVRCGVRDRRRDRAGLHPDPDLCFSQDLGSLHVIRRYEVPIPAL